MAYEFAPDEDGFDNIIPTAPEFWRNRIDRIAKLPPNEPRWASFFSVFQDPNTCAFGVDSRDLLPQHVPNLPFQTSMPPIGIMRVWLEDGGDMVDGFLVDLRYASSISERELNFSPGEDNEHETVPEHGVLLRDEQGAVHFRSHFRNHRFIAEAAVSMMQYFDSDYDARYKRQLITDYGTDASKSEKSIPSEAEPPTQ